MDHAKPIAGGSGFLASWIRLICLQELGMIFLYSFTFSRPNNFSFPKGSQKAEEETARIKRLRPTNNFFAENRHNML